MKIVIINGPNLNLLGVREPEIYGKMTFDEYFQKLRHAYPEIELLAFQSNVEGELVNLIQLNGFNSDGIILNAGGYTHTSIAIADAVAAINTPVIEVHLSNIFAREPERRVSLLSKNCKGIISGLGIQVYEMALITLAGKLKA